MSESLDTLLQHGYRYALSLAHHAATAEDLLQDAWVAVIQAGGPHEKSYLFSAIRTRYYNLHKRERLVPMVPLESIPESISAPASRFLPRPAPRSSQEPLQPSMPLSTPAANSEQRFANHEIEDPRLEHALALLRGIEREVLYLSAVEGYTAQEITTITGQARGTVLSMLSRIRNKIQRHFAASVEKAVPYD